MWCINAHEYAAGEAKMIKIFAIYPQASGFPSLSSEYAFECCRKQRGRYGTSLSYISPDVDLVAFFYFVCGLPSSCLCRFPSGVRCRHLLSPVLEARRSVGAYCLSLYMAGIPLDINSRHALITPLT